MCSFSCCFISLRVGHQNIGLLLKPRSNVMCTHDRVILFCYTYLAIFQYRKTILADFSAHHRLWVKYFTFRYFPFTLTGTRYLKNRDRRRFVECPTLLTLVNNAKYNCVICWETKNHVTLLSKFIAKNNVFIIWLCLKHFFDFKRAQNIAE